MTAGVLVTTALPTSVLPRAAWRVAIDNRDITREITEELLSVSYTDHLHGEVDDVELVIADTKGRWRDAWYPTKGDRIELWIGHAGGKLMPCGRFQIDEVETAGPPSTTTIRALAAGLLPAYRTKRSQAFEAQSLRAIAESVAQRHSLTLVGTIEDIRFERKTQKHETDLSFLTRVAEDFGYVFTIRGAQLVFYKLAALEDGAIVATIARGQALRYQFTDASIQLYRRAEVSYKNDKTGETITGHADDPDVTNGDVLEIRDERVENAEQASALAAARLKEKNRRQTSGTVVVPGDPRLVAGTTATLTGFGKLSGKYSVETSTHRATRSDGYVTDLEVKRVAA